MFRDVQASKMNQNSLQVGVLVDFTVDLHQEAPQQKEEAASTDNGASAPSNSVGGD